MSRLLKVFAAGACAVVLLSAVSAQASILIAQADTTNYNTPNPSPASGISAWIATPNSADSTGWTSGSFAGNATNIGQFGSSDQNTTSMGQSFAATTGGALSDIQIIVSGNPSGVITSLALYDAGSATGSIFANTGSQTYTPGGNVSANLLTNGANITLPTYTTQGANGAVLDFQFSGADAVNLTAGEEYIFALNGLSTSAMFWGRMANNALDYPNGQAFKAGSPLNGNPARDWSLSVTVVPEPTTLTLLGLALPGMLWAARKRQK